MEVLSLSQQESSALSSLEAFSPEQIGKVCRVFLQRLALGGSSLDLEEKVAAAAELIGSLLLNAAKTRSSDKQLLGLLQEHSIGTEISQVIVSFYQQYNETIERHLDRVGIAFPHIVGIEWRLDYMVRSKAAGRENLPMFHVALKVMEDEKLREVTFLASLEEMQDLLAKVRDAVKQVERVVNANAN